MIFVLMGVFLSLDMLSGFYSKIVRMGREGEGGVLCKAFNQSEA